jgi:hypothetical protein
MKYAQAIYSSEPSVVMYLHGKKYRVTVDVTYDDDQPARPNSATVTLELTDEPVTECEPHIYYCWFKFGGYPEFMQGEVLVTDDDGNPYTFICTINSHWGDSGNGNVFALIKDDKVIDVYLEASCA